jgi:hypothetical protein
LKYLGNGALDAALKYLWTLSITLIFYHTHNTTFQRRLKRCIVCMVKYSSNGKVQRCLNYLYLN